MGYEMCFSDQNKTNYRNSGALLSRSMDVWQQDTRFGREAIAMWKGCYHKQVHHSLYAMYPLESAPLTPKFDC